MARSLAGTAPGRMNRKFLIVAVLLATLSAVLVYAKISAGGDSGSGSAAGDVPVVVAKTAIKQRTTVTADMLEVKNIGGNAVAVGAFGAVDDVVGKVTKFPIEANQQVVNTAVLDTTKPANGDSLALVVPESKRAFSIQASQVLTAGGLLLPGDYVDVVWVCCKGGLEWQGGGDGKATFKTSAIVLSRLAVQNVQVAAVAQQIVSSGPVGAGSANPADTSANPVAADAAKKLPDATTITLLVTPEQANTLIMAESTGELRAALRNPGDQAIIPATNEFQFITPGLVPPEILKTLQDTFTTKP